MEAPDEPKAAVAVPDDRRLQMAYLEVFGSDAARSSSQKLVWRDIESFCRAYRLSVESITGGAIPDNNFLVNEGRRSYWLRARGHILAAQAPQPAPLKVSRVKRKP